MKTTELFEETKDAYLSRLMTTLGIKRLGKGHFGQVFQHPQYSNVAVKVFQADPKYARFIRWCLKHQANRFIPKVIDFVTIKQPDGDLSIVFFQKLSEAKPEDVKKELKRIKTLIKIDLSKPRQFNNFNALLPQEWQQLAAQTKDLDLAEFAQWMVTNVTSRKKPVIDLHNKNVMMRGTQLVFTDPAA